MAALFRWFRDPELGFCGAAVGVSSVAAAAAGEGEEARNFSLLPTQSCIRIANRDSGRCEQFFWSLDCPVKNSALKTVCSPWR